MNNKTSIAAQNLQEHAATLTILALQLAVGRDNTGASFTVETEAAKVEHLVLSAQCLHHQLVDLIRAYGLDPEEILATAPGYASWNYSVVAQRIKALGAAEQAEFQAERDRDEKEEAAYERAELKTESLLNS